MKVNWIIDCLLNFADFCDYFIKLFKYCLVFSRKEIALSKLKFNKKIRDSREFIRII